MATTLIDSAIFGDIFSTDSMRRVWSDGNRTQKYLDIESALARAQARLGIIPKEAAEEINRHCRIEEIDLTKLKHDTERIGYPVLGVVWQLNALCRDRLGQYCHWGATTQDITDTATVLQMREALGLIESDLKEIADALAELARKHRDTPMIGRSNLQQAVPITFLYRTRIRARSRVRLVPRIDQERCAADRPCRKALRDCAPCGPRGARAYDGSIELPWAGRADDRPRARDPYIDNLTRSGR
jgi:3-carboxy-cis,cis-muconate cycloisomerase